MLLIKIYIGVLIAAFLFGIWWYLIRKGSRRGKTRGSLIPIKVIMSRAYGRFETRSSMFVMAGDLLKFRCKAIELPDNGNQQFTSCIPEGTYEVEKVTKDKFGECFHVIDVPGRGGVLIHIGNYAAGKKVDTEGCIMPGMYFVDINNDGYIDVADSTRAMNTLLEILPERFTMHVL